MIDVIIGHYNYWVVIVLMMAGFYTVISRGNLIKKIPGIFQQPCDRHDIVVEIGFIARFALPLV